MATHHTFLNDAFDLKDMISPTHVKDKPSRHLLKPQSTIPIWTDFMLFQVEKLSPNTDK